MSTQRDAVLDALMTSPNRLDKLIAYLAPGRAVARLAARRAWSYEAAKSTRLRGSAKSPLGPPENFTRMTERLEIIRQVRDLEENFGLWQGVLDKLRLYAFGRVEYQQRTSDPEVNKRYEEFVFDWMEECDIGSRFSLEEMAGIAFQSHVRDGDVGNMFRRAGDDFRIQLIESDRIGGAMSVTRGENYFQGITVDLATGRPLSYEVFSRTAAGAYVDPVQVPANQLSLYFVPRRYDQARGISAFAPIVNEARDLKEVLLACLAGTKLENYHAAIGYTPTGRPLQNPSDLISDSSTETTVNGAQVVEQEIKPGMIQWAPSTAEYEFIRSDRPSGTFQTYVELLVKLQGVALNLPFSFLFQMLGTGPAVRADLQQASRVIAYARRMCARRFLNPSVDAAIVDGVARGEIPYHPEFRRRKWLFTADPSIDAGRESAAKVAERNAGLRSSASVFDEAGEDSEEQEMIIEQEVTRKIERANKIAKATGVSVDFVLTMLGSNTPNGFLFSTPEQQAAGDSQKPGAADAEENGDTKTPPEDNDEAKMSRVRGILTQHFARQHQELRARLARRRK